MKDILQTTVTAIYLGKPVPTAFLCIHVHVSDHDLHFIDATYVGTL